MVEELVKYMKALTFLQLQAMTGVDTFGKPEVLLQRAGFTQEEIAELLGKKRSAVSMALSRSKSSGSRRS
jgi:hypothetical protein